MRLYNTLTKELEEFQSTEKGKARVYTCGPTVYNYAHIGNLRAFMLGDIITRVLRQSDYDVTHVENITDVDDKTIHGAHNECISLSKFTEKFTNAYFRKFGNFSIRAE